MNFDLYVEKPEGDIPTRLRLLITEDSKKAARNFVELVHGKRQRNGSLSLSEYNQYIRSTLSFLSSLVGGKPQEGNDLPLYPKPPDLSPLPIGSWFIQFTFTLAKPWISKDDDPLYVADSVNPVRKDKVFKVPMMAATSWKGRLRWTMMHTNLALKIDELNVDIFAQRRFNQTLLFGDEQGEEPNETKGFSNYLDSLKPEARPAYERILRQHYDLEENEALPHYRGRLYFFSSFFDRIDVEVINPHPRDARAGKQPIYLECVPPGSMGVYSLLYVPFDLIGKDESEIQRQALADLQLVAHGLKDMFLTYGFGAKTSSGYGVAEEKVDGGIMLLNVAKLLDLQEDTSSVPQTYEPPKKDFLKYMDESGNVKPEFKGGGKGDLMSNSEYKEKAESMDGGSLSEFKLFRSWYLKHGERWRASLATQQSTSTESSQMSKFSFHTLSKLCQITQHIAKNFEK